MNLNASMFGQAISFVIFVWLCMKYVWPPLVKLIDERRAEIAQGLEQTEKAAKEWREKAIFNTKGYMALESIAQAENIHVTQQDMEGEYELLAKQTNQKVEEIQKRIMSNPDSLNQTTTKLLGQKTMNFIYSNCEFEFYKEEAKKG